MALDWNERYAAIASALRALEIDPKNARAMAFLAEAYKDSGQYELAGRARSKKRSTPNQTTLKLCGYAA